VTARLLALNALVAVVLAALVLAGVELWLRLTLPASSGGSIYEYTLDTPRYKRMKASASVVAWGAELKTNDLGFRDAAPSIAPKRRGELRIVVLGDSFTVSAGVPFERIYTSLVEDALRERSPGVRVINLAVGGYNIVQYALVLEEVGLALQPDMVLVALFPENDFTMSTYDLNYRVASGREAAEADAPWYESLYVDRAYGRRLRAKVRDWLDAQRPAARADAAAAWEKNRAALRSIAHTAKARNLPLAVALLPRTWNMQEEAAAFERVRGLCREEGLSCLDLREPLMQAKVDEASLRLNFLDPHPNEKYNALVAAQVAPFLAGLMP
jgi:GDSL-like Lipase/Acylhydrolase family